MDDESVVRRHDDDDALRIARARVPEKDGIDDGVDGGGDGDADRQREIIIAEAYRKAQQVKGEGDARASATYAKALGQNPEFFAFFRTLESYKAMGENTTLVLDADSEFFRYLDSTRTR